jgi:hypothetical protein
VIVKFATDIPQPGTKQHLKRSKSKPQARFRVVEIEQSDSLFCWQCKTTLLTGCIVFQHISNDATICRDCLKDPYKLAQVNKFECKGLCEVIHMTSNLK